MAAPAGPHHRINSIWHTGVEPTPNLPLGKLFTVPPLTRWELLWQWWGRLWLRKLIVSLFSLEFRYESKGTEVWQPEGKHTKFARLAIPYGMFVWPMITWVTMRLLSRRLR